MNSLIILSGHPSSYQLCVVLKLNTRRYSLNFMPALSKPNPWLGLWYDQGILKSCSFIPPAKWVSVSSICSGTALTEYSQHPSLLYGPLLSTKLWKWKCIGSSLCKQMEDTRSHLSYTKLTPLLRCLSPLMTLDIGVQQSPEPLQSSRQKWIFPFLKRSLLCNLCPPTLSFWIAFKIRTGITSHTFSFLRRYCLEQTQNPLIEGKTG